MKPSFFQLFACVLAGACLSGCGVPGIPLPPSLNLPQPVTDLRAIRKGNRVRLVWTVPSLNTEHRAIRNSGPMEVCRSPGKELKECRHPVGQLTASAVLLAAPAPARPAQGEKPKKTKLTASYVDTLPDEAFRPPAASITYAIDCLSDKQRSAGLSNLVQVPGAPAVPPPEGMRAQVTSAGVVVGWQAVPERFLAPGFQYEYRVYRRADAQASDTLVGTLGLETSNPPEIVDRDFEWEKTYEYRATVATLGPPAEGSKTQVEGEDTPWLKVWAHKVFPPEAPTGLQAVFSGVGQQPFVDLIWNRLAGSELLDYNVYRREGAGAAAKINPEQVKTTSFRDTNVQSGKTYFYSVSAVDAQGNESPRSAEAHETVP
jgi:hypothetical protein